MAIRGDDELAELVGQVPGVKVMRHYRGDPPHAENCYLQVAAEDEAAVHRLCRLSARANAPLHVYEQSESELRYTLVVNNYSRRVLLFSH